MADYSIWVCAMAQCAPLLADRLQCSAEEFAAHLRSHHPCFLTDYEYQRICAEKTSTQRYVQLMDIIKGKDRFWEILLAFLEDTSRASIAQELRRAYQLLCNAHNEVNRVPSFANTMNDTIEKYRLYIRSEYQAIQGIWDRLLPSSCLVDIFVDLDIHSAIGSATVVGEIPYGDYSYICDTPARRIVFEGEPGSGKTTYFKKMTLDWANGDPVLNKSFDMVFFLCLSQCQGNNLFSLLTGMADNVTGKEMEEMFQDKNQQRVLLLLDSFDECGAKDSDEILNIINLNKMRNLKVLISTRLSHSDSIRIRHMTLAIKGFSEEKANEFITRQDLTPQQTENMERMRVRFRDCAKNPLLLVILTIVCKCTEWSDDWNEALNSADGFAVVIEALLTYMWEKKLKESAKGKNIEAQTAAHREMWKMKLASWLALTCLASWLVVWLAAWLSGWLPAHIVTTAGLAVAAAAVVLWKRISDWKSTDKMFLRNVLEKLGPLALNSINLTDEQRQLLVTSTFRSVFYVRYRKLDRNMATARRTADRLHKDPFMKLANECGFVYRRRALLRPGASTICGWQWEFLHLTLAEFIGAYYLSEYCDKNPKFASSLALTFYPGRLQVPLFYFLSKFSSAFMEAAIKYFMIVDDKDVEFEAVRAPSLAAIRLPLLKQCNGNHRKLPDKEPEEALYTLGISNIDDYSVIELLKVIDSDFTMGDVAALRHFCKIHVRGCRLTNCLPYLLSARDALVLEDCKLGSAGCHEGNGCVRKLSLINCTIIDARSFIDLLAHLSLCLSELHLQGNTITDMSFISVLYGLKDLRFHCVSFTEQMISSWLHGIMPQQRYPWIFMMYCDFTGLPEHSYEVLSNLKASVLVFDGCQLSQHFPKMVSIGCTLNREVQRFWLFSCRQLSKDVFAAICLSCQTLLGKGRFLTD